MPGFLLGIGVLWYKSKLSKWKETMKKLKTTVRKSEELQGPTKTKKITIARTNHKAITKTKKITMARAKHTAAITKTNNPPFKKFNKRKVYRRPKCPKV